MIDLAALKQLEGHVLDLRFNDGLTVRGRLIDVDLHSKLHEIIYDPIDDVEVHVARTVSGDTLASWAPV
ncbi:MAG TPA: hypothetical protein VFU23_14310 [Gemmatimonadales bacterium]|nr:hypothetical protein [Gemmatimonadales bacterium]